MDARERLRLYLEQRRDMGESDLVLDSLPVDDVLRLLGDKRPVRDAGPAAPASPSAPVAGDWRATLKSVGADSPVAAVVPPTVSSTNSEELSVSVRGSKSPVTEPGHPIVIGSATREL